MFLKTNLGYLSQIALKSMQLLIQITISYYSLNIKVTSQSWSSFTEFLASGSYLVSLFDNDWEIIFMFKM